jgi:phosphotransferase system enzyme I (PtsI)
VSLGLYGIGVSRGIAMGKAYLYVRGIPDIPEYNIPPGKLEHEIARFNTALKTAKAQLKKIRSDIPSTTPREIAEFIDIHLLMLEDSSLALAPIELIRTHLCNAEWALKRQHDRLVAVFDEMDDAYLRTRRDDVEHVVGRVQRLLLKHPGQPQANQDEASVPGRIVVAEDLTPADTVLMQHQGVAGFITEHGGPTSHTAILARSLRIPAVVGVRNATRFFDDKELLIIDGGQGTVIAEADEQILRFYRERRKQEHLQRVVLTQLKQSPSVTRDGHAVALYANLELPEELPAVCRVAAAGIGLYRTEFLFLNRDEPPGEEEQLHAYLRVIHALPNAPVTIRTVDIGADKSMDARDRCGGFSANPALGLRAIRLCLKEPSLFRPQLRAILRASAHGSVRMMLPMLTSPCELTQILRLLEEIKRELRRQGLKYDTQMPLGGMVEVPAAAIAASALTEYLDFLSIGTNDLIQYTLAIDRINDEVNYLYDPLHPAVLKLINMTIKAGHHASIPVGMCGEMASDTRYTRLLLGMGLDEFSTDPGSLLEVKKVIMESNYSFLSKPTKNIVNSHYPDEIVELVDALNQV